MSNDSNRDDSRTISPSELQASDFFPPGTGWNKDEAEADELQRKAARYERDCRQDGNGIDGVRPH
jgi:hypothetical protein